MAALGEPADRRLAALLDAFVDTMLTPPDRGGRRRAALAVWPPDRVRAWLAWLAASMTGHNLTEFYLERLQPTWLAKPIHRWLVRLAPAICCIPLIGLICWLIAQQTDDVFNILIVIMVSGPAVVLATFSRGDTIEPARTLRWSLPRPRVRLLNSLRRGVLSSVLLVTPLGVAIALTNYEHAPIGSELMRYGLIGAGVGVVASVLSGMFGMVGGIFAGVLVGIATAVRTSDMDIGLGMGLFTFLLSGIAIGLREVGRGILLGGLVGAAISVIMTIVASESMGGSILENALGGLMIGGVLGGLLGSLSHMIGTGISKSTTRPNQGIHRSIRQGSVIGTLSGAGLGWLFWLSSTPNNLYFGIAGAVAGFLFGGLAYGGNAAIRHYTLRLLVARLQATPRRDVVFLDAAADSLLLRRVGGGYRFPHQLFQERFATYPAAAPVAPAPA
jgi:hypothetical protein